jgi:NDP-4-keto-2,6-dideoxyhexose 3-C-methyltransferase
MIKKISKCRVCGNSNLVLVVNLDEQYLTGVFPKIKFDSNLTKGPLRLVKCHGDEHCCGLLQLEHSYDSEEMYGENYGYRSGLNPSMVSHLKNKVSKIIGMVDLNPGDLVVDIGSNDGTTLSAYPSDLQLVGIDPTGEKFAAYYPPHISLIPNFFSADLLTNRFPEKKAMVITSFSMFYDLENPVDFARQVASVLDPHDGMWVFEQSYMPLMLERNSYDTICHEHLEYYGLQQIVWIAEKAGLKIVDVEINDVNGGSFSVIATLKSSVHNDVTGAVSRLLDQEKKAGLSTLAPYEAFFQRIQQSKLLLQEFISNIKQKGERIVGIGASTKGNVLLQYCGFTENEISVVGDVNPDKYGSYTPGTNLPIIDEKIVLASEPDYLLILPWHFRKFFLENPLYRGKKLVFPLPILEVVEVK